MARDHDHLLGMLASLEVCYHIVRHDLGERLRRKRQMQLHRTLAGEVGDKISVLSRHGAGWNACRHAVPGMR